MKRFLCLLPLCLFLAIPATAEGPERSWHLGVGEDRMRVGITTDLLGGWSYEVTVNAHCVYGDDALACDQANIAELSNPQTLGVGFGKRFDLPKGITGRLVGDVQYDVRNQMGFDPWDLFGVELRFERHPFAVFIRTGDGVIENMGEGYVLKDVSLGDHVHVGVNLIF